MTLPSPGQACRIVARSLTRSGLFFVGQELPLFLGKPVSGEISRLFERDCTEPQAAVRCKSA